MVKHIVEDIQKSYGITCGEIASVAGGWLNLKWKISAEQGNFLVKQFSFERFTPENLRQIEAALQRQMLVKQDGVLCPYILPYKGHAIRLFDDKTAYMVMDFCSGKTENAQTSTEIQMKSLGSACGTMHKAFQKIPYSSVKGFPLNDEDFIALVRENFSLRTKDDSFHTDSEYQRAVLAQKPIIDCLSTDFLKRLPKGISHEDFAADNLLFYGDSLWAIIDFDRNQYNYIWHDVGRAILSFALENNELNLKKILAFVDGYSQKFPLTMQDIPNILRMSWCIEAPWWIQPSTFHQNTEKVIRFKHEILWLTEHWFELDSLF
ncbi:MAG: phosphotransferase [Oscillospiraceae bacterium]